MKNFLRRVPRLERVCCCMPLRGGLIFLVYFNLIISVLATFAFTAIGFANLIISYFIMTREERLLKTRKSKLIPEVVAIMLLLSVLSELAMTVVALVGIHKNVANILKIYLHYAVGMAFSMLFIKMFDVGAYWFIEVPIILVYISIKCYYILAVRSQVKIMEEIQRLAQDVAVSEIEMAVPDTDIEVEVTTTSGVDDVFKADRDNAKIDFNDELQPIVFHNNILDDIDKV